MGGGGSGGVIRWFEKLMKFWVVLFCLFACLGVGLFYLGVYILKLV